MTRVVSAVALLLALLGSPTAWARESTAELARRLKEAEDFRVRTQAALALGGSGDAGAVEPLCGGLGDGHSAVRAAAAAALGKLRRGGKACLEKRLAVEKDGNVQRMLEKAIRLVAEAEAGPAITASTKLYLAIGKVADETGRGGSKVADDLQATLAQLAGGMAGFAVAPRGESADEARRRLRQNPHVYGYLLVPTVKPPRYDGDRLEVVVEVKLHSYPDDQPEGFVTGTAAHAPVAGRDASREDELIARAAQEAMFELARLAAQL